MAGKKFSLIEVILSVICVVFTIEAAAPASAMGNVQFFWWIFLIITFLLPYGLVVAELGTAFDSEGGLYDWVRLGLGDRWGARCSWCYWVNFPLWAASIACMFPSVINAVWGIEFSLGIRIAIEIAFVWGVTVMAMQPVAEADWVMDGGAVIKVLITAVVGIVGIWFACNNGFANDMSFKTFIPDLGDTNSLTYLSIILFNFMGFEVVATFASTMKNPSRDIPKAVIAGGVAIAAIYIICGIGIGAAVPTEQLSLDSGIVDAVAAMVGRTHPLTMVVGVAFLVTLFANMICWSFGVNNVASYAARHGNMPRPFALVSKKTGMPNGSALINGCFASLVLLLQIPLGEGSDVFWVFFSMNVVFLLMSYIPMFPAFWRLRKYDDRPRALRGQGACGGTCDSRGGACAFDCCYDCAAQQLTCRDGKVADPRGRGDWCVAGRGFAPHIAPRPKRRQSRRWCTGVRLLCTKTVSAASCAALGASWITVRGARDRKRA